MERVGNARLAALGRQLTATLAAGWAETAVAADKQRAAPLPPASATGLMAWMSSAHRVGDAAAPCGANEVADVGQSAGRAV